MATPILSSLTHEITVTATAAGRTKAIMVTGKRSALCPLPKNGAPVYSWGFQSGITPPRICSPA